MRNCATRRCSLAGTVLGLAVTYLFPVLLAVFASGLAQILGLAAWLLMALAFQPILRFYRVSPLWGVALPAIAATYMAFTLDFRLSACTRPRRNVEGPGAANLQDADLRQANLRNGNVSEPR